MDESPRSRLRLFLRSPLFLILLGITIVTVVVAIILIPKSSDSSDSEPLTTPAATITNLSDYLPDLDKTLRVELARSLYTQAAADGNPYEPITATIREDSLHTIDYNKYHTGDFLIDLADLQLTYLVSFQYGTLADREIESIAFATFYCPSDSQLIYSDFACSAHTDYVRPTISRLKQLETAELSLSNE